MLVSSQEHLQHRWLNELMHLVCIGGFNERFKEKETQKRTNKGYQIDYQHITDVGAVVKQEVKLIETFVSETTKY